MVTASYLLRLVTRFDGDVPSNFWTGFVLVMPWIAALHVGCNMVVGVYWRNWRLATIEDTVSLLVSPLAASLVVAGIFLALGKNGYPLPLSVILVGWLPTYAAMCGVRWLPDFLRDRWHGRTFRIQDRRERVLVVGAGSTAHDLVRDLDRHSPTYRPVAVVSDDTNTAKLRLGPVRVEGRIADLPRLVSEFDVDVIAIAMPEASKAEVRRVVDTCLETDARIRVVPNLQGALDGVNEANGLDGVLRLAEAEDFLGRQSVSVDLAGCQSYLAGRRVLITGAAGSIGSELARQVSRLAPWKLFLLDVDETGLFHIENELQEITPETDVISVVGSVEDLRTVTDTVEQQIEVVFHAAAYKHVSLMEKQPGQAIQTNVFGTRNLLQAAARARVERFIFISTDKAVVPSNVMGASKRVAEGVVHGLGRETGLQTAVVRFGNVLGSRGSVLPVFERQIRNGGPVTVTHPDVRRYFMTIPEAVMLVIQAGALTQGNETFVLRMGDEMSILDLARKLIRLRGHRAGLDIPIVFTGLQPGEKLVEELSYADEALEPTAHPDISSVRGVIPSGAAVRATVDQLAEIIAEGSPHDIRQALFAEAAALFAVR
ncbi:MAG: polysaccharide biosynthesis protein [Chloroflexi bacterium]|nr:polysaccharide biosynthesis protein [Chloroflexota bacterium]